MPPCKVICRIFLPTEKKYFAWHWTTEIFSRVKYWFCKRRKFFLNNRNFLTSKILIFQKEEILSLADKNIYLPGFLAAEIISFFISNNFLSIKINTINYLKHIQLFKIQSTFKIVHHTLSCFLVWRAVGKFQSGSVEVILDCYYYCYFHLLLLLLLFSYIVIIIVIFIYCYYYCYFHLLLLLLLLS